MGPGRGFLSTAQPGRRGACSSFPVPRALVRGRPGKRLLLTQRRPVVTKKPTPLKPLRLRLRLSKLPKRGQLGQ